MKAKAIEMAKLAGSLLVIGVIILMCEYMALVKIAELGGLR